jgi:hypothetical protein
MDQLRWTRGQLGLLRKLQLAQGIQQLAITTAT